MDLVGETARPCRRTTILRLISRSDGPVRDDLVRVEPEELLPRHLYVTQPRSKGNEKKDNEESKEHKTSYRY